jgi:HK97 family phage prohead protease
VDAKNTRMTIELKADQVGEFVATFATLNVIDKDGDVTVPGAFQNDAPVRISAWSHNWGALPVGKGVIHADEERAWVDGEFFLQTAQGKETYETVKALGGLQEWSYGFDITDQSFGKFDGQDVRFLRGLEVHEVSPVMIGAGVDTRTDRIKGMKDEKRGARNSARDAEHLQAAHDALVRAGVTCSKPDDQETEGEDDEPKADGTAGSKADGAADGTLRFKLERELLELHTL